MRILFWLTLNLSAALSVAAQSIAGFTPESAAQQTQLEQRYQTLPRAANAKMYLKKLTEEPHIAGSPESKAVAEYIHTKYQEWGLDSKLVEYHVYLPYPEQVALTLIEPDTSHFDLHEPSWRFDKDAYDSRAVLPFNAYSPSGSVQAQVVYVNRGLPDDYAQLEELGVEIDGKIALARYGGSFRGVKAKVAEERGASGLIIYSDPADDGYMKGDFYPHGPMRPPEAVQRGSLLYIFQYPGDPLTPGIAATKNVKRLKHAEATSIANIPTLPISYGNAQKILQNLAGEEVADGWQGGLPFRYHVGPGPAKVQMQLKMDYQIRPIYNVIVRIPGAVEPEKLILIGNHHDAWVYGAVDPNSGTATVMEIGRCFGELLKSGWQPKRTLVLAHWDAEEYGILGSTEWVEDNKTELAKNAVLYINIDSAVSGANFGASAVPSLDNFIQSVTKTVRDPTTKETVFARWWQRLHKKEYKKLNQTVPDTASVKIGRLGSGSDYTAFLQHAGIPCLSMGFGGRYGVYHSILDNFFWMQNWGDPTFEYHAAMAKIGGLTALRFTQADVFPFEYTQYAATVVEHIEELEKSLKKKFMEVKIDFSAAKEKAQKWQQACEKLQQKIRTAISKGHDFSKINAILMNIERDFLEQNGLPGRKWFKHRIYAPGLHTGYAAKPLTSVAEAAERKDWQQANQELQTLLSILNRVLAATEKALNL
ncbi:MAG: M28 family metallopeptidase [bacterium]